MNMSSNAPLSPSSIQLFCGKGKHAVTAVMH